MPKIKHSFSAENNSHLVIFRILFGFLIIWQAILSVVNGWVKRNLIEPEFTFSHIGMEWLQPLPGNGMYWYFVIMALAGVMVMIGFYYRFGIICYTVLWAGVYFMQKTVYNNHYYLLMLLCIIMIFMPANKNFSFDSRLSPEIKSTSMPAWCRYAFIAQLAIVYFYAAIAKLYPEWLNGTFTSGILNRAGNHFNINFFKEHWFHIFIAWSGIVFDLLIVPLLLWRKTRFIAVISAVAFHLFNSFTLHIGVFPYLSLALLIFFFPTQKFNIYKTTHNTQIVFKNNKIVMWLFSIYFIIQLFLPLRHHFIKGDVLWTEEGHRLSWRMMLRKRSGYIYFKIKDRETGKEWLYDLNKHFTPVQIKSMKTKPDMIWQTAQYIKQQYNEVGKNISVYVTSKVSVNKLPERLLINPKTDMAEAEWNYLFHNEWVLTYEWEK